MIIIKDLKFDGGIHLRLMYIYVGEVFGWKIFTLILQFALYKC